MFADGENRGCLHGLVLRPMFIVAFGPDWKLSYGVGLKFAVGDLLRDDLVKRMHRKSQSPVLLDVVTKFVATLYSGCCVDVRGNQSRCSSLHEKSVSTTGGFSVKKMVRKPACSTANYSEQAVVYLHAPHHNIQTPPRPKLTRQSSGHYAKTHSSFSPRPQITNLIFSHQPHFTLCPPVHLQSTPSTPSF